MIAYTARARLSRSAAWRSNLVRLADFVEDMEQAGLVPSSRVATFTRVAVPREVADGLRLAPQAEVVCVERLRLANDDPLAYDITWLPLRYGVLLHAEGLARETIDHPLETRDDIPIEQGVFTFAAASAMPMLADALDVASGTALASARGGVAPRQPFQAQDLDFDLDFLRGIM